jgi:hypothetical protein
MPEAANSEGAQEPLATAARPRVREAVWWFGLAATSVVAVVLSAIAYSAGFTDLFEKMPQLDKAVHFGLAGALAFFLDGALRRRMVRFAGLALPLASLLILIPVAIEEFMQRFSMNRTPSFADFAADVAGVVFFVWLSRRLDR